MDVDSKCPVPSEAYFLKQTKVPYRRVELCWNTKLHGANSDLATETFSSICMINATECHLEKMQVQQNQALRCVLSLPAYVSVKDLHDGSGVKLVKDHLITFARMRLRAMRQSSQIVNDSVKKFNNVRHIQTNCSPMDILLQ